MSGRLIGIARARIKRGPMEEIDAAAVSVAAGIEGDRRGVKPGRQVTVLFREGWEDACEAVGADLPWTTRRANLYVEGVERPRAVGARIAIGALVLEVTEETAPCILMEQAHKGLMRAMRPEWRGGACCNVVEAGEVRLGDAVRVFP